MNTEATKSHYEILQVSPEATSQEIEDAYNRARVLYGKESVAFYSPFSEEERKNMLDRIDAAYTALKDPAKRRYYDPKSSGHSEKISEATVTNVSMEYDNVVNLSEEITGNRASFRTELATMDDIDPLAAEQYRIIYTKLEQISSRNSLKSFAVTSALMGEGKTSTSVNLAYVMAEEFKKKVILVECDLKNPSIPNYFKDLSKRGLVDVLTGKTDLDSATVQIEQSMLYLLPAGRKTRNSSELLSSPSMRRVLSALKEKYDYLIIDCPPILPLADMNILSKITDGQILVVRAGKTPKDTVVKAAESISGADIIGIVLNGAENTFKDYYY